MNIISIGYSSGVYWKELVFMESRLGAEEKTAHLKGTVAAQRAKYDDIWRAEREIEFAVSDTQAQGKTAESRIDSYMENVYSAILHEVKQKRKDPRYAKLIKMNFSAFKKLSFSAQKQEILRMKDTLELDLYDDLFRDAQHEHLDKALVEIDRVLAIQKQLERRQMFYRQDVEKWKNETNQVRMDIYGALILLSDTTGESWARSFFPVQKKAKKLSAQELANLEEARAEKRAKKSKEAFEREQLKLEDAQTKARIEKEKADLEDRLKADAKNRVDDKNGGENPVSDPVSEPVLVLVPDPVPVQQEEPAPM